MMMMLMMMSLMGERKWCRNQSLRPGVMLWLASESLISCQS